MPLQEFQQDLTLDRQNPITTNPDVPPKRKRGDLKKQFSQHILQPETSWSTLLTVYTLLVTGKSDICKIQPPTLSCGEMLHLGHMSTRSP